MAGEKAKMPQLSRELMTAVSGDTEHAQVMKASLTKAISGKLKKMAKARSFEPDASAGL